MATLATTELNELRNDITFILHGNGNGRSENDRGYYSIVKGMVNEVES